ncbi:uncharacterized protein EV420DRAFT_1556223 [Desarmillaria tabescens]|uniref:Ubiquitin-like domain-containing protein n=1 Tax=Armillaria tabescens TaxID=1929756 RepID=A0AA39K872_ARMTA|nr:uncharacterized protein EV420DRAFT_1556223 [Desarmillaria tabescens]KAK0454003.1 hypothetical protein EV420DRAFT_1556223 [Desarmillaria tabescens]
MAEQAELAFVNTFLNTIMSQPVTYPDDYHQPPENSLKKVPVLQVPLPAPPQRKQEEAGSSSSAITLTFKSLKPASSTTLRVSPSDTVLSIKSQLSPANPAAVRLLLKGKALADNKLLLEYPVHDGDIVNLILKDVPPPDPPVIVAPTPMKPAPITTATPATPSRHTRIPSVVLSPSPSPSADKPLDISLSLDTDLPSPTRPSASTYHNALAKPEMWDRLYSFLRTEFTTDSDAQQAFEDFLRAGKTVLTANEVARIRDHVGVVGMAGT